MAASTLLSNIPSDRSSLKKTDGKQKVKDYAAVQVGKVQVMFSGTFHGFETLLCRLHRRKGFLCQRSRPHTSNERNYAVCLTFSLEWMLDLFNS